MREIKFRGLDFNSRWVYGDLIQMDDRTFIAGIDQDGYIDTITHLTVGYIEVKPETVGQFTGLKDRKGSEIYEGDVASGFINGDKVGNDDTIIFEYGAFRAKNTPDLLINWCSYFSNKALEVIGNIHQKPCS